MTRPYVLLIAALCFIVSVSYGALYYGFAVLITEPAAGGEFSRSLLSAAYGGAVLTGGAAAIPVGRIADRRGVRGLMALGAVLAAAGLVGFSLADAGWQVLAVWWLLLGPATALCFYEPAYVAVQQAFEPERRARAIATLTLAAGLSGPIFTPATGALVDAIGWRDATRVLAVVVALAAPVALAWARTRPSPEATRRRLMLAPFRRPRLLVFTLAAVLAYGSVEALVIHRVARFEELGFALGTVALWAGISALLSLPGRIILPLLSDRAAPTTLLAGVIGVIAVSAALMIGGASYGQMVLSFALFGLVVGAALPLRAIAMGQWTATEVFGAVMGVQAALIALGRAGVPALTGVLHDLDGSYTTAMALLAALLVVAAILVAWSARAGDRVAGEPDQQRAREVRAQDVLPSLALGGGGADLVGDPLLGDPEQRHRDQAPCRQCHAEHAHVRVLSREQRANRFDRHVWSEHEELDRHQLLGTPLGRLRQDARAGEAPDDDHAGEALDRRVEPEPDQRDRARDHARDDRHHALDAHRCEREPRQQPHAPSELAIAIRRDRGDRSRHRCEQGLAAGRFHERHTTP